MNLDDYNRKNKIREKRILKYNIFVSKKFRTKTVNRSNYIHVFRTETANQQLHLRFKYGKS